MAAYGLDVVVVVELGMIGFESGGGTTDGGGKFVFIWKLDTTGGCLVGTTGANKLTASTGFIISVLLFNGCWNACIILVLLVLVVLIICWSKNVLGLDKTDGGSGGGFIISADGVLLWIGWKWFDVGGNTVKVFEAENDKLNASLIKLFLFCSY